MEQIDYIEILRGASSVLYGASASSAVINIVTKSDHGKPISVSITSMIGTHNSVRGQQAKPQEFQNRISLTGSYNRFSYGGYFSHRSNDGLSAIAPEDSSSEMESDAFKKTNLHLKLGYMLSKRVSLSTHVNFDLYNTDYDQSFGFVDANYHANNKQLRLGVNSIINYDKGNLNFNGTFHKTTVFMIPIFLQNMKEKP